MADSINSKGIVGSASCFAVTPSDSATLTYPTRGIYVGVSGDVAVILQDDTAAVTFKNMVQGCIYPMQVSKVMSTNTTATNIVALR